MSCICTSGITLPAWQQQLEWSSFQVTVEVSTTEYWTVTSCFTHLRTALFLSIYQNRKYFMWPFNITQLTKRKLFCHVYCPHTAYWKFLVTGICSVCRHAPQIVESDCWIKPSWILVWTRCGRDVFTRSNLGHMSTLNNQGLTQWWCWLVDRSTDSYMVQTFRLRVQLKIVQTSQKALTSKLLMLLSSPK